MKFNFNLPVNILFGCGRINELGAVVSKHGKRALLVISSGSAKRSGLLDKAVGLLSDAGVSSVIFDKVSANPTTLTANEAATVAKSEKCDCVVGIGGGSIMDAAKAAAFIAVNDGDVSDYIFGRKSSDLALPLVLVPTTCGTGSEGNGFAVLTNPDTGDKKSLRCNAIVAKASIVDPELMTALPKKVLASVGFDALCHCMEAYISTSGGPLTDALALSGIAAVKNSLTKLYEGSTDIELWEQLTLASTIGGMVIGVAGVTTPHGLEHPASGLKNITHGEGLAALTPVIFERSISSAPEKFRQIAILLGGKDENDCVALIRELLKELNLNVTLTDLGITEADIPWMTENALKVSAAGISWHPRVFDANEIAELFRASL